MIEPTCLSTVPYQSSHLAGDVLAKKSRYWDALSSILLIPDSSMHAPGVCCDLSATAYREGSLSRSRTSHVVMRLGEFLYRKAKAPSFPAPKQVKPYRTVSILPMWNGQLVCNIPWRRGGASEYGRSTIDPTINHSTHIAGGCPIGTEAPP